MAISLTVNGSPVTFNVPDDKPLLWALREDANLVGTKFGCGIAMCGACTVHVNGEATRTCVLPCSAVAGKAVTTIEGISAKGLNAVQQAWIEMQVPQCGYCQSGFIMAVTALLDKTPNPSDAEVDAAITNLCRCGTYPAMRKAIKRAVQLVGRGTKPSNSAPNPSPPAPLPKGAGSVKSESASANSEQSTTKGAK